MVKYIMLYFYENIKEEKMFKKILKITALMLSFSLLGIGCSSTKTNPRVRLTLENGGVIEMELYPDAAPLSCELFLDGVKSGYYDGKVFHRAVPGFMIQGGSPNGDGIGGMGKEIKGEFASNGFDNPISHKRGVVSLARTMYPNSASGQFFIMHDDGEFLDGEYAAFGMVTSGMEYVDEIAVMPTSGEMLIEKPIIKSMVIIED